MKSLHLVIIGGGIAGSSLAFWAFHSGHSVTLIDKEQGTASTVPSALINPVRGQNGQVVSRGIEGMRCTWKMLEMLEHQGFTVSHNRYGVYRPLPDLETRLSWSAKFPESLSHRWLDPKNLPKANLQDHWHSVLEVSEAGWLSGLQLIKALKQASEAHIIAQRAKTWSSHFVDTEKGERIQGDAIIWCGGSWGAVHADLSNPHRQGSLLLLDTPLSDVPVSFGVYATPCEYGGVLGATFEAPESKWINESLPLKSLHWLISKAEKTFSVLDSQLKGTWTGTRLGGKTYCGQHKGHWILTGLGSKGFLLGPLLAQDLLKQIEASV